jgi:hypothetical protein
MKRFRRRRRWSAGNSSAGGRWRFDQTTIFPNEIVETAVPIQFRTNPRRIGAAICLRKGGADGGTESYCGAAGSKGNLLRLSRKKSVSRE